MAKRKKQGEMIRYPVCNWEELVGSIYAKHEKGEDLTLSEVQIERAYREEMILDLLASNKSIEQVAHMMGMSVWATEQLRDSGREKVLDSYTKLSPHATFLQYAAFHMRLIRRLDQACDRFMSENSTQYNALVGALKAESEIYDKIFAKGVAFGVINKRQVKKEAKMKDRDLLKALQTERAKIDDLIGELEVSVEKRKIKMRVSRRKQDEGQSEEGVLKKDSVLIQDSTQIDNDILEASQVDTLTKSIGSETDVREMLNINFGEKDHQNDG